MAEMAVERGLAIDGSCIWRWVQVYGPELDKRCRPHLKRTNRSWRLDETYINIKGRDRLLYRAVDSIRQTIDFLLTDRRDAAAAKRFFRRALLNEGNSMPRVINVDKNAAYPRALEDLKREGAISRRCRLRQCKYLNNLVEQVSGVNYFFRPGVLIVANQAGPPQCETPNVASERLRFTGDSMADVARNRGDGHGEEG
jgi:IS6 family transposase